MNPPAEVILERFLEVARLASVEFFRGDLLIESLGMPHKPTGLPLGSMAIYVFSFNDKTLKVGKAGPNSDARYRSQHYNPGSAASTLASSILRDGSPVDHPNVDLKTIGDWIRQNTERTNFILSANTGIAVLTLLESFIQCVSKPAYEGFSSQR